MRHFIWGLLLVLAHSNVSSAAFALFVDPADLQFNGPGNHSIDFVISHNGVGASSLSGYTIRLGQPANANLGVLPSGVSVTAATQRLNVSGSGLFSYNQTNNTVAASNLAASGPFADIGNGGSANLFTLDLVLGAASSYTVGVDFQNAQRGGLFATDISAEFFNPNSPTTDFSFTLQAVPEPSSITMCVLGLSLGSGRIIRRLRSGFCKQAK